MKIHHLPFDHFGPVGYTVTTPPFPTPVPLGYQAPEVGETTPGPSLPLPIEGYTVRALVWRDTLYLAQDPHRPPTVKDYVAVRDLLGQPIDPAEVGALEELLNVVQHGPVFPGKTLSHATARHASDLGWIERDAGGRWVPTVAGRDRVRDLVRAPDARPQYVPPALRTCARCRHWQQSAQDRGSCLHSALGRDDFALRDYAHNRVTLFSHATVLVTPPTFGCLYHEARA